MLSGMLLHPGNQVFEPDGECRKRAAKLPDLLAKHDGDELAAARQLRSTELRSSVMKSLNNIADALIVCITHYLQASATRTLSGFKRDFSHLEPEEGKKKKPAAAASSAEGSAPAESKEDDVKQTWTEKEKEEQAASEEAARLAKKAKAATDRADRAERGRDEQKAAQLVELAEKTGKRTIAHTHRLGPIACRRLDLAPGALPPWLAEGTDFDAIGTDKTRDTPQQDDVAETRPRTPSKAGGPRDAWEAARQRDSRAPLGREQRWKRDPQGQQPKATRRRQKQGARRRQRRSIEC